MSLPWTDLVPGRDFDRAEQTLYDLIVVGGGIYGVCLTLEASRRGWKVLLLERNDFGGDTSWSSLRIIHGGLRYLQTFDIRRHRDSVAEQAWWLQTFPEQIRPLACLMPLYNQGLRRDWIMRGALAANNWLNRRVRLQLGFPGSILPAGQVLDCVTTREWFPEVRGEGLVGGALWHDGLISSPQRLTMELLNWSRTCGATLLNYVEAEDFVKTPGVGTTVRGRCHETERNLVFQGKSVVLCRGAGNRGLLPNQGYLAAYNLLINRPPLSTAALAISRPRPGGQTYFLVPYGGRTLLGTVYESIRGGQSLAISTELLDDTLCEVNQAHDWGLTRQDVLEVWSGVLPARKPDTLAGHPTIVHHPSRGACLSVVGVKYTTARRVAERTLRRLCQVLRTHLPPYVTEVAPPPTPEPVSAQHLQEWLKCEHVQHIDDLLLRWSDADRTDGAIYAAACNWMRQLGWDGTRQEYELSRLRSSLNRLRPIPEMQHKDHAVDLRQPPHS